MPHQRETVRLSREKWAMPSPLILGSPSGLTRLNASGMSSPMTLYGIPMGVMALPASGAPDRHLH